MLFAKCKVDCAAHERPNKTKPLHHFVVLNPERVLSETLRHCNKDPSVKKRSFLHLLANVNVVRSKLFEFEQFVETCPYTKQDFIDAHGGFICNDILVEKHVVHHLDFFFKILQHHKWLALERLLRQFQLFKQKLFVNYSFLLFGSRFVGGRYLRKRFLLLVENYNFWRLVQFLFVLSPNATS